MNCHNSIKEHSISVGQHFVSNNLASLSPTISLSQITKYFIDVNVLHTVLPKHQHTHVYLFNAKFTL